MKAFMIAAPHSGSGKTVITLGLLRALRNTGVKVASAKAGPDYIDPAFHAAASGVECVNLDPWAMRPALVRVLSWRWLAGADAAVVESMMGLYDGAADGTGSAADLAAHLRLPVVLVIDASRMAQSVAALVGGYRNHRPDLPFAGVILNRVGSERHEAMLRQALAPLGVRVFGVVPSSPALDLPSRHLGLVQAGEHASLEAFIEGAAAHVGAHCDLEGLLELSNSAKKPRDADFLRAPGKRVAVARDEAFAFAYPHLLTGWRLSGAQEIAFFSPLADEAPPADCDAVYLPGGYPELHAARLAAAGNFLGGLRAAAARGAFVYGECGGYMVLGDGLVDADGARHPMAGLLRLETSFAQRKRHLGYRRIEGGAGLLVGRFRAHEFHYSTALREDGEPLFANVSDATGARLPPQGLRAGNVCGSYMHLIDMEEPA
jgi:cobyrinic acid a,c-diamide synthase